ncbi:hypothetical protein LGL55_17045 [Clostridium tagluense]|uniref:hypothetical protein n=1 Tax=Clostridium tagluense TaxID=360422 RepID=UPI001CF22D89|nr:hypothetical protein [Clostridium tagluense]MCB2313018.1 hypothetical protein [Clostridium tagluense]MCB2317744.1 hypothetical protein [Clostridium tagluense]MCB2322568.1 hypothetical protein [Clostridium tagluense]MCB2327527.1 hypothetical protein [Clostridium tagluense]MCB2332648.1 hypothetical protein [Clostridium tagluense]
MINKKLNFFYFGEDSDYGNYNPVYDCNTKYTPKILHLIASNEPFSISKYEIIKILNMTEEKVDDIITNLQLINAIEVKDDTFRIKFPVFLEEDVIKMKGYLSNIGQVIGDKIISLSNVINQKLLNLECSKYHSKERILYHIMCEDIFDHTALVFFTKRNIFSTPKLQHDDRTYIRVAYEDIKTVDLPCSKLIYIRNSYSSYGLFWYGHLNDPRKDMYRFFRLIQKGIDNETPFHDLNIGYNTIIDDMNKEIARKCGKLISNIINKDTKYNELTLKEKNLVSILKELGYADINQVNESILVNVPLFYASEKTIIEDISDTILFELYPVVRNFFENFEINVSNLTSIRHMVDIKEISNELWHQIFGSTNEYLVKKGFIELPHNVGGESLYLRSITTT